MKLLGYDKVPNQELIDFQPTDSGATNHESTDGDCTVGYSTDRKCAQRKAGYCERATCNST